MDNSAFLITLGALITVYYAATKNDAVSLELRRFVPWAPPERAKPYLPLIVSVEAQYGVPSSLLARVLDIESGYRPEIIDGSIRSSAGALGIAQFIPRYHPTIDPLDPASAIPAAGKYLSDLYAMFGTWPKAVAAYNWGLGNLKKHLSGEIPKLPNETANYLKKIWGTDSLV